ncbi:MAG: hypothetical protein V4747_04565 [Pseudomonadota bacterium]|jgi:hypothetical protein
MKRILLATALTIATVASASAMTMTPTGLSSNVVSEIQRLVPGADLTNISTAQLAEINGLFANSDNLNAGNNPRGALKAILNQQ